MYFDAMKGVLMSDTLVPDLFLSDYMPGMPPDAVKLYLYCSFLAKYGKKSEADELGARLDMETDVVNACFVYLEKEKLLFRTKTGFTMTDIKEQEINRLYRKRTDSLPEEALANTTGNIKRIQSIDSINRMFFQGLMAPSWYTAIDLWFHDYKFDEDVMVSLVKYCHDMKKLGLNYVKKVAETWHHANIRTNWDLERYMQDNEVFMTAKKKVTRLLRRPSPLTEPEENYLKIWLLEYQFSLDIISYAIEKTTSKTNANFDYLHGIMKRWFKAGYKTKENVIEAENNLKKTRVQTNNKPGFEQVPKRDNFEQRTYDDDFFDKLTFAGESEKKKSE